MLTFLRNLLSEYTFACSQVICNFAVNFLPETSISSNVFLEESLNPARNESHERPALTVQQGQFTTPGSGRGGVRLDSAEEILAKEVILVVALEILAEEAAILVVAEEILIVEAGLVAEGEILVVEKMKEERISNKI